jgi:hypothetical protein
VPRGGHRVGAGRKPRPKAAVVLDMDGIRREPASDLPPAASPEERAGLLDPPPGTLDVVKACWRELAPKAIAERTLVPSTEAGFLELCIRMANVRALDDRIQLLGIGTQDSLPYLKERRGQAAQMASSLKDFKLSAFGKPATSDKPKPAANPWGAIAGKAGT